MLRNLPKAVIVVALVVSGSLLALKPFGSASAGAAEASVASVFAHGSIAPPELDNFRVDWIASFSNTDGLSASRHAFFVGCFSFSNIIVERQTQPRAVALAGSEPIIITARSLDAEVAQAMALEYLKLDDELATSVLGVTPTQPFQVRVSFSPSVGLTWGDVVEPGDLVVSATVN